MIHQRGGGGLWTGCLIGGRRYEDMNNAPVAYGIYVISAGGAPSFSRCTIRCNLSRFGTFYFDSTENLSHENLDFYRCEFLENTTVSSQYGAVAWCVDDVPGRSPLITFDLCRWLIQYLRDRRWIRVMKRCQEQLFSDYNIRRVITSRRLSKSDVLMMQSSRSSAGRVNPAT